MERESPRLPGFPRHYRSDLAESLSRSYGQDNFTFRELQDILNKTNIWRPKLTPSPVTSDGHVWNSMLEAAVDNIKVAVLFPWRQPDVEGNYELIRPVEVYSEQPPVQQMVMNGQIVESYARDPPIPIQKLQFFLDEISQAFRDYLNPEQESNEESLSEN
ncbi:hypothetical protein ACFL1B_00750 [Nanoarchaeota archaeon]